MPQCVTPVVCESLNVTLDALELQLSCPTASGPSPPSARGVVGRVRCRQARGGHQPDIYEGLQGPLTLNGDEAREGEGPLRARRHRTRPTPAPRVARGPTLSGN